MEQLPIGEGRVKVRGLGVASIDTHGINVRAWIRRAQSVNAARTVGRCLGEMCLADKLDDKVCAMVQLTF